MAEFYYGKSDYGAARYYYRTIIKDHALTSYAERWRPGNVAAAWALLRTS